MRELKIQIKFVVLFAVIVLTSVLQTSDSVFAADTTKPTLSATLSTKDYTKSLTVTVKATDQSGIKTVKWATGYQKTSYFKSKGTTLKLSKSKATVEITENGTYTFYALDKAGNTKIKRITVETIDQTNPVVELSDSVMNQVATIHVDVADAESGIKQVLYLKGDVKASSSKWKTSGKDITGSSSFTVKKTACYTVKAIDTAGNEAISKIKVNMQMKAVWISYLEFSSKLESGFSKDSFTAYIEEMFDNVVDLNMNAVIVQVRPFSDAMYSSKYFPWSKYVSGTQGVAPGFDPLKIMVSKAHERGLEIHAWVNPYRVASSTNLDNLSKDNPAKKWLTDDDESNDRNVLTFNNALYYNPASGDVRKLIVNGVKEIVRNYDIDGIHFDDYFYPNLANNYMTAFDAIEYDAYVEDCKKSDKIAKSIADWRRGNVNTLIKKVYAAIKDIDESVVFGISPTGAYNNVMSDKQYYADIETWLSTEGYIDYICPQLYWVFDNSLYPFDETVDWWVSLRTCKSVNVYIGIASYRAGSNIEEQWNETSILADMVTYAKDTGLVDGFMFYRYDYFYNKACLPAVEELLPILEED